MSIRFQHKAYMADNTQALKTAVLAALAGDWHAAHNIAQDYSDVTACWLHAVLHKIQGDEGNSRYWYAKTGGKQFEHYADANIELKEMLKQLI